MATAAQAEAAAASLRTRMAQQPWFAGAEVARQKCGGDVAHVMVLTRGTPEQVQAFRDCPATPRTWQGVKLEFVAAGVLGLGAAPALGLQDFGNVLVGFMCFYGTFTVGKIAIDSILEHRREQFDPKGQPPAAVKAKEGTVDGIVKVLGLIFGAYQLTHHLPVVLQEAKELLK